MAGEVFHSIVKNVERSLERLINLAIINMNYDVARSLEYTYMFNCYDKKRAMTCDQSSFFSDF